MDTLPDELVGRILCSLATHGWDGQRATGKAACVSRRMSRLSKPLIWPARDDWWTATWEEVLPQALSFSRWDSDGLHPLCTWATDAETGRAGIFRGEFHKSLACLVGCGIMQDPENGPAAFVDDLRNCATEVFQAIACTYTDLPMPALFTFVQGVLDLRDWPGHPDAPLFRLTSERDVMHVPGPMPFPLFIMHMVAHRRLADRRFENIKLTRLCDTVISAWLFANAKRAAPLPISDFVLH